MKAYLFLAFFLLQLLSFKPVSAGLLEQVCGMVGDNYATEPCLSIIGGDPRSKTIKDIRDMALIAADVSIDRAIKIQSYAKKLLENATVDADTKLRVEVAYRIITDTLKGLKFVNESLIAKVFTGANPVAFVAKYSMLSADSFISLAHFGKEYLDVYILLTALISHM